MWHIFQYPCSSAISEIQQKTSDFLKNQKEGKEEENIELFKEQIDKVLNVLKN